MSAPKPVVLCILDGWGLRAEREANAVAQANTPNFDRLMSAQANATLITHGVDVGLPEGQMGNSEVGHMNIGAGRVIYMDLGKIDHAIADGSFAKRPALTDFIASLKATNGTAHLMSVVSDGGVHGHMYHLLAAVQIITRAGVSVIIHAMTDGRDVAPTSAAGFVAEIEAELPETARFGTVIGRFFAMDRDNRWERVGAAYDAIMRGKGGTALTASAAINQAYDAGENDEFIKPRIIGDFAGVKDGDGIFCMNFRADRAREILASVGAPDFSGFDVSDRPRLAGLLGMVEYSNAHNQYMTTVYPPEAIPNTLGSWVADHGKSQFRLAETEKYPHVTFFLNGGKESPESGEDRDMPQSPKVATYDLQPEMSSVEVADKLAMAITSQDYDLIVVNFANPDMVGHTGDLAAAMKACKAVDRAVGQAITALTAVGGAMIVTADHGNCETMVDPDTGGPHTAHTTNPVPVALIGGPKDAKLRSGGRLADLAPTLLELMELPQPIEMTGKSLLIT